MQSELARYSRAQLWLSVREMHTRRILSHDLNLRSTCTGARGFALRYSVRRRPDADKFRILVQRVKLRHFFVTPDSYSAGGGGDTTIKPRFVEQPLWQTFRDLRVGPGKCRASSRNLVKVSHLHVLWNSWLIIIWPCIAWWLTGNHLTLNCLMTCWSFDASLATYWSFHAKLFDDLLIIIWR